MALAEVFAAPLLLSGSVFTARYNFVSRSNSIKSKQQIAFKVDPSEDSKRKAT